MVISNELYDKLKWIAQFFLPALGTLYFALAGIWGFPYGEEIVGTIVAIDTFLGALLGISTLNYEKEQKIEALEEEIASQQTLRVENIIYNEDVVYLKGVYNGWNFRN